MIFCDSHSHLYLKEFDADRAETVERSNQAGVKYIFLPNVDEASINPMYSLCDAFPNTCFPILGLHPCSVRENYKDQLSAIFNGINEKRAVAVGEIGIDLFWDKTYLEEQKKALIIQLEKAVELDLPVVIHTRESFEQTYTIINDFKGIRGVYHCFSGDLKQAEMALAQGFYLGIGGVVTYKNAAILHEVAKEMPLERMVLESDAPYLTPAPFRGQRNESAYVIHTAKRIAELRCISLEALANQTTQNTLDLFKMA